MVSFVLANWVFAKEHDDVKLSFYREFQIVFNEAVGEYEDEHKFEVQFIPKMMFITVLMFNLLIAIISDTYDRVQSNSIAYDSIEKINLILEKEYIMAAITKEKGEREYLHMVTTQNLDESADENMWEGKIKILKD